MIVTGKKEWNDALKNAPDVHEVHTIYKRVPSGPNGINHRQIVIGRRIVADGHVIYEEVEDDDYARS